MYKKLLTSALLSSLAPAVFAQDLLITAVVDGPLPGGLPKAMELLALDDISDLSLYGIESVTNGNASGNAPEFTFPNVSVSAGEYIYVATESTGFNDFFGFNPDYTSGALSVNGDDPLVLYFNGAAVDVYGQIGTDGTGQFWEYQDGWAARDPSIATPTTTFTQVEWVFSGANELDGESTNADAATPVPLAGSAVESPEPEPEDPAEEPPLALISAVQGNPSNYGTNSFGDTDVSPMIGETVTLEGVVVGDFQNDDEDTGRNLDGFYLMEEDADHDDDATSSEGIFVSAEDATTDAFINVDLGDVVRVSGTVAQDFGETQLTDVTALSVVESLGNAFTNRVSAAEITLTDNTEVSLSQDDDFQPDLESYEGMLVRFPETLTITEQFQLDRFNEIRLVAGERPRQFTQENTPDVDGFAAHLRAIGARSIVFDDGLNEQNANIANLFGFTYNEAVAPRMGDQITGLTGVLDYKWAGNSASSSTWRVRAHQNDLNTFTSTNNANSPNPRPTSPEDVGGSLSIASLNVLNFFTTLDDGSTNTAAGLSPRGADDLTRFGTDPATLEFDRQLTKLVNAIIAIDADILGLVEIENEFNTDAAIDTAIETLVDALNTEIGSETYDFVYPGEQFVGSDAIAVALIYKPAIATLAEGSNPALLDDEVTATLDGFTSRDFDADPLFDGPATNRVPLAASFQEVASGDVFTLVVNHYKSKGQSGIDDETSPNFDQNDGASFWNARRLQASQAILAWLATNPTGVEDADQVIMGDLNSYAQEDPIQHLLSNGFVNVESQDTNSFVFDGQTGTLDYILLSDALNQKLNDVTVWSINSDEADALDYNADFSRDTSYFDETTATRNSDHDPVIVGLNLVAPNQAPTADAGSDQSVNEGETVTLDASLSSDDTAITSYAWAQTSGPVVTLTDDDTATPSFTAPAVDAETALVFEVTVNDAEAESASATVTVTVLPVSENQAPVADAGDDQSLVEGNEVNLDASASSDDQAVTSFAWTQTSGPTVTLNGDDTATPSFTAPEVDANTDLVFEVTVSDEEGLSSTDQVTVTIENQVENNDGNEGDDNNGNASNDDDDDDTFGCSYGGPNAPVDPTLPLLAVLALLYINRKKFTAFIR